MSTPQIGAALDVPADLTPPERLILVQLARFANDDGMAFPSVGSLARGANVSPSTVTRSVRRLEELRLLQRVPCRNAAGVFPAYRVTLVGNDAEGAPA
jgi:DNA-binding MarR family transcriptional regulator